MSWKNILTAFAILVAFAAPLSGASTVTLTGGCPLYVINQSRSYITFNIANTGNGTASDLIVSASFPGITQQNSTLVIPNVNPDSNYTKDFQLSSLVGQGSYAVNINATYVQAGSNYATVFPCIIYIGSSAGGPLEEAVSVKGQVMSVDITNIAPQSIEAQVDAVVPPVFSVENATRPIAIGADGHALLLFNITTPTYTDASFPVIGELSYEYNGTHYAQMASGALDSGLGLLTPAGVGSGSTGGIGITSSALAAIVAVMLVLLAASLVMRRRKGDGGEQPQRSNAQDEKPPEAPQ